MVLVAPIRGVDLFVGTILQQLGEKCDRLGWGEENQSEVGGKTPEVNVLPRDITDKTDFFIGNSVNLAIY